MIFIYFIRWLPRTPVLISTHPYIVIPTMTLWCSGKSDSTTYSFWIYNYGEAISKFRAALLLCFLLDAYFFMQKKHPIGRSCNPIYLMTQHSSRYLSLLLLNLLRQILTVDTHGMWVDGVLYTGTIDRQLCRIHQWVKKLRYQVYFTGTSSDKKANISFAVTTTMKLIPVQHLLWSTPLFILIHVPFRFFPHYMHTQNNGVRLTVLK